MMDITYIIECLENNKPVAFSKYGDGEFICAARQFYFYGSLSLANCDSDAYTDKLAISLINSFKYMVEKANNSLIGKWQEDIRVATFWQSLVSKQVIWADYQTLLAANDINNKDNVNNFIKLFKLINRNICKISFF